MTDRPPAGPVVPDRISVPLAVFLFLFFLVMSLLAILCGCSKSPPSFREREVIAEERIADALERAYPALPLVPPEVGVRDLRKPLSRFKDRAEVIKRAPERAAHQTTAELLGGASLFLAEVCKQNPEACR